MQLNETNSPFTREQADALNRLLPTLAASQKIWLSGFLAAAELGAVLKNPGEAGNELPAAGTAATVSNEVTVLYGSQTGNAKGLALKTGKALEEQGFQVTVSSMNDFNVKNLKKIARLLLIVSTHGEGEPPDPAVSFHEFLHSKRAPKLDGLRYSVLALGDSSYTYFCETGKQFDARLEQLGAARLYPRVDCDVDYDEPAADWLEGVLGSLRKTVDGAGTPAVVQVFDAGPGASMQTGGVEYNRNNPFHAEVLENINLNGRGSSKETRHLELSLEGSGLRYAPGDCIGIYPENDPALVDQLLAQLNRDPKEPVTINKQGEVRSLRDALISHYEITVLSKPLLEKAGQLAANEHLRELVLPGNEEKLRSYIYGRDVLDLVRDFGPWGATADEFVSVLRRIPARLYSISSSYAANPDEVHATIGVVRYRAHERLRKGVCSAFCAERVQPGDTLPIYVHHNENFKLPDDPDTPIIMVGPGTGIAPFRSFMQEREEKGMSGKSWLFFGDRNFRTDFLYQLEWQKWLKEGVLTKMDVAFSRDTDQKVYVQHRMLEKSKELYRWLQEGAVVYICGDEKNMARDVHNTLLDIIETEGGLSRNQAEEVLAGMQRERRYQRDVY